VAIKVYMVMTPRMQQPSYQVVGQRRTAVNYRKTLTKNPHKAFNNR